MRLSQNTQKLVNIYNLDFGEWGVAENIVMMVLRMSHCLYGVRMCSFFHSSMMVSLILPSSQRRSMASSACLAKYCPSKRRMSFISSSDLTLEISSSISIWNGVNGDDCKVDASIFNLLLYFVWVQMYDKYAKFANK